MKHSQQQIHPVAVSTIFLALGISLVSPNLTLATDLPIYGGLGGNPMRGDCPKGSYLVGLAGRTGAWIDRIAPICAPWRRGSQTFGPPSIGPSFGTSMGGQERQTFCNRSGANTHAIQSWWIHLLRSDDHFVQYVEVFCTSLPALLSTNSGNSLTRYSGHSLGLGTRPNDVEEMVTDGPFGSKPPFQACPDGEAAVGIRVRAGRFVDAIGLICGPLPAKLGGPSTTVIPGAKGPPSAPATRVNPVVKVPDDMFTIIRPATGDRVQQGQLVITATPPKVGGTQVTELELKYLDAPPTQAHSYPYTTIFSIETAKLLQGYPVAQIVTGGYAGRWQVRARAGMKAVPGRWSFPVQFQLVVTQPTQSQKKKASPVQKTAPLPSTSVTQPSPIPQTSPLPPSSVTQVPAQGGSAPSQMRRSSSMIMPRGVEEKESVEPAPDTEKKP